MTITLKKLKTNRINILIIVLVFIIYGNAINNEYSLDDNIVVDNNVLVEKGVKAIPEIFTSRYAVDKNQQYDYRPLVSTSFAIEKQFFKKLPPYQTKEDKKKKDKLTQANISHFVNILLYALTCIVLYQLLLVVFVEYNVMLPLIVLILYLVHPLHTEVVVNIKSRDEIFVFLFMLLALKQYLRYGDTGGVRYLFFGIGFVFLSFLAKRNGFGILGVLPVLMYFKKANFKKILIACFSLILVWLCFFLMKKGIITQKAFRDLKYFENPLIFEGGIVDRITVGLYCALHYLKMLIFPYNMSFYYGYNQIPMATFKNWEVWVSMLLFVPSAFYGFKLFLKRNVLGLGILLWFGLMLMVINVLFPIVGIVADRFTYMFSLGFCIVAGYGLLRLFKIDVKSEVVRIKLPQSFVMISLLIMIMYSGRVISRNSNWHDYLTLYEHDIEHLGESAKAHALISNTLYPKVMQEFKKNPNGSEIQKDLDKLIYHFKESVRIDSTYVTSWNNLGSAYINFRGQNRIGLDHCKKALAFDNDYLEANMNVSIAYDRLNIPDSALKYYVRVFEINPDALQFYDPFNKFLVRNNMVDKGVVRLERIAEKSNSPKNIYSNMANLTSLDRTKMATTIEYFVKAYESDTSDKRLCNHIVKLYGSIGDQNKVNEYLKKCIN